MKGFSFIEVLICVVIASIVIAALISLVVQNLAAAQLTLDRFIAANLAQEGVELIANFRSNNWSNYSNTFGGDGSLTNWRGTGCTNGSGSNYCLIVIPSGKQFIVNYNSQNIVPVNLSADTKLSRDNQGHYCHAAINNGCNIATPFSRTISIYNVNNHEFRVDSSVNWVYNNQPYHVGVEERFYNWR